MKLHYTKILLFSLPLNIFVHNKNKQSITPRSTPITRLLCECDLYIPNYDNDPEMKEVMDNFNKQTQQRFEEYDERMKEKRMQCKERCDKEIQKIILRDKLEKELMDKFATLQTDIQSDAIPTCVCEKSITDKVEKGCLRCAQNLGGIVVPSSGVLAGIAQGALYAWKPTAFHLAMRAAMVEGATKGLAAGLKEGKEVVIRALKYIEVDYYFPEIFNSIGTKIPFTDGGQIAEAIITKYKKTCQSLLNSGRRPCETFEYKAGISTSDGCTYGTADDIVPNVLNTVVKDAKKSASDKAAEVTLSKIEELQESNLATVELTYGSWHTAITASIIAIVVIVLIMVIIYLILRYRRKKKMKKKLQYIKLLEE
nr:rifin PIR protein,putative [Plasmodium sp. DRC-Itaito]